MSPATFIFFHCFTALGMAAADLDTQLDALASGIAGLPAPLNAAGTRSALGLAAADLDTQLDAILAAAGGTGETPLDSGTAQAGGAQTITLRAGTTIAPDTNTVIVLTGGLGAGQTGRVASYNGTTKVATMADPWNVAPNNTTTYSVLWLAGTDLAAHRRATADAFLARNEEGGADGGRTVGRNLQVAGGSIVVNADNGTFTVTNEDGDTVGQGTATYDTDGNLTGLQYE